MHSCISWVTTHTCGDLSSLCTASHSTRLAVAATHVASYGHSLDTLICNTEHSFLYVFPWGLSPGPFHVPLPTSGRGLHSTAGVVPCSGCLTRPECTKRAALTPQARCAGQLSGMRLLAPSESRYLPNEHRGGKRQRNKRKEAPTGHSV